MLKFGKCAAENRHTTKSWMGDRFTVETAVMLKVSCLIYSVSLQSLLSLVRWILLL